MKTLMTLALLLGLGMMVGCGGDEKKPSGTTKTTTSSTTTSSGSTAPTK